MRVDLLNFLIQEELCAAEMIPKTNIGNEIKTVGAVDQIRTAPAYINNNNNKIKLFCTVRTNKYIRCIMYIINSN